MMSSRPNDTLTRARQYLAKIPPAVSGAGGHQQTFKAAVALVWGFGLDAAAALTLMHEYNARCSPPWSDGDLAHKINDAAKLTRHPKPRGHLLTETDAAKPAPHMGEAASRLYASLTPKPLPFTFDEIPKHPNTTPPAPAPAPIAPPPIEPKPPETAVRPDNEARRIAGELQKIHQSGFSMPDDRARAIMAAAIHIFNASYEK